MPAKTNQKKGFFKKGLFTGIGWAFGVTIGFAIISTILVFVLRQFEKLPFVGDGFEEIITTTEETIQKRTPLQP